MSQTEQTTNQQKENKTAEQLPALETMAELEACLEAVLFAAGYPMKYSKLSEVLGVSEEDVKRLLEHMQPAFNDESSHRGIQLLLLPETAQLCTKERFAP